MTRNKFWKITGILTAALCLTGVCYLIKSGFWITSPFLLFYPVTGVDVSSYQGDIDWPLLAAQDIDFAYIKATEGSTFYDKNFQYNWKEANKTSLRVGAYHFFSFDSGGKTQAANFIRTVESVENMLPPAVDLEFYGDKARNQPDRLKVRQDLQALLRELERHYGVKPILYATKSSYEKYIAGDFKEYDIWIRNLYFLPFLEEGRPWVFWQYSNRRKLRGYQGKESRIDLNYFNGSRDSFRKYPSKSKKKPET
ncbi:MAG: glycoside hydrolase family 25 protein [Fusobacteriaceae bacterium]|jgi:lysozyme|nr:glycoside hydrolase family 25 protein [Fusobacteriaceae bacterium]